MRKAASGAGRASARHGQAKAGPRGARHRLTTDPCHPRELAGRRRRWRGGAPADTGFRGAETSLVGLALLDSVSPSALVVSLLLVVACFGARRLAVWLLAYAAGIMVAMVGVGVALMTGSQILLDQVLRDASSGPSTSRSSWSA